MPAATPLMVILSAFRSTAIVARAPRRSPGPPRRTQPAQQLDLHEIDRVDVRIAHVDRSPEHRVVVEQLAMAGDREHARRWPARAASRSVAPSGCRSAGTSRRSYSAAIRGSALASAISIRSTGDWKNGQSRVHRAAAASRSSSPALAERLSTPSHDGEQQPRLRPGELPGDRAQRLDARRRRSRRAGRLPMCRPSQLGLRRRRRGSTSRKRGSS